MRAMLHFRNIRGKRPADLPGPEASGADVEIAADTGGRLRRGALPGPQQRLNRRFLCVEIRLQDARGHLRLQFARLSGHGRKYQTHIHTRITPTPAYYRADINDPFSRSTSGRHQLALAAKAAPRVRSARRVRASVSLE